MKKMTNRQIINFLKEQLYPRETTKHYKEPTTEYLTVRFTKEDLNEIDKLAEERDVPPTVIVREFVKQGLQQRKAEEKDER